jgi:hypothetical protein
MARIGSPGFLTPAENRSARSSWSDKPSKMRKSEPGSGPPGSQPGKLQSNKGQRAYCRHGASNSSSGSDSRLRTDPDECSARKQ